MDTLKLAQIKKFPHREYDTMTQMSAARTGQDRHLPAVRTGTGKIKISWH